MGYLQELPICNSAFPARCRCQDWQPRCCNVLITSRLVTHRQSQAAPISWQFCTFTSFCLLLSFVAQQNSVPAYFTFLNLAFTLFMVLYPSASSFLLCLSLMHFLCHFVPQASHVESPARPQMPSSFLVSTLPVSLSCCPRECIYSKLENSSKPSFCTVKKQKLFHLRFKSKEECTWERDFCRCRAPFYTVLWGSQVGHLKADRLHIKSLLNVWANGLNSSLSYLGAILKYLKDLFPLNTRLKLL